MLILLIKTRLNYYRNYIRYHFDRTTKIEIALIVLILVLLTFRSPADIGYNFKWLHDEKFPYQWASFFSIYLIIFYLLSEGLAFHTLRLATEWQLLGTLPFPKGSILNYYLLCHLSKTGILILIGCLPFLFTLSSNMEVRALRFFTTMGILLFLQFMTFYQAHRLRNTHQQFVSGVLRWFLVDALILIIIVSTAPWLRSAFSKSLFNFQLLWFWLLYIALPVLWVQIHKNFNLPDVESNISHGRRLLGEKSLTKLTPLMRGFYRSFFINDLLFLWRKKRSSAVIPVLFLIIAIILSLAEKSETAGYVSLLFLELLFSLLLIDSVLHLFKRDVAMLELIRSLPITAASFWMSRWLLVVAMIAIPLSVPIIITLFKFGIGLEFFLFLIAAILMIPGSIAVIFCNSGFGMFPHVNLSGYLTVIVVIVMVLFWFFMPFGTLMLLAVMILWIRKSQRNFQYLEV